MLPATKHCLSECVYLFLSMYHGEYRFHNPKNDSFSLGNQPSIVFPFTL